MYCFQKVPIARKLLLARFFFSIVSISLSLVMSPNWDILSAKCLQYYDNIFKKMIKKCLKKKVSINSLKLVFLLWKFPTCAMHLLWWGLTLKRKCSKLLKRFCTIATVEKGTWTWWKTCESNKLYLNLIKRNKQKHTWT